SSVSVNGRQAVGATSNVQLTISQMPDGSASESLSYRTRLTSPAFEVALSIANYHDGMKSADMSGNLSLTAAIDGKELILKNGSTAIEIQSNRATLTFDGEASSGDNKV